MRRSFVAGCVNRRPGLRWLVAALLVPSSPLGAQVVFAPPVFTPMTGAPVSSFAAGDIDGDGRGDVVVAHGSALVPGARLGDGAGGFGDEHPIGQPVVGETVALADLDGDGRADLLVGGVQDEPMLFEMLSLGDGTFGAPTILPTAPVATPDPLVLHLGDADSDGDLDVVSVDGLQVRLFVNDGTGVLLAKVVPVPAVAKTVDAFPCDIDGDGQADVLLDAMAPGLAVLHVIKGLVTGGFLDMGPTLGGPSFEPLATVDVNGDGYPDLIFVNLFQGVIQLNVFLAGGRGDFGSVTPSLPLPLTFDGTMTVADFDGDGHLDVVFGTLHPDEEHFVHGSGLSSFVKPETSLTIALDVTAAQRCTADMNGDGRPDVVSLLDGAGQASPGIAVALNHSYAIGGPVMDLGHALKGSHGWPIQLVDGTLVGGTDLALSLSGAPPASAVFEVLGVSEIFAPFKGGVLVPSPDILVGPLLTDAGGALSLETTWPAGVPAGTQVFLQGWFADAGAPQGFAASTGVSLTAP